jgi:hypothetical protein
MKPLMTAIIAVAACAGTALAANNNQHVTFDDGPQGWSMLGYDTVTHVGGNPGAMLHFDNFYENFWMNVANTSNPNFIGDYTAKGPVTLSIDVRVNSITFFGQPVPRDLVLILHDYDEYNGNAPASVWFKLGTLPSSTNGQWLTFEATIDNVNSDTLPAGWNGAGDEDPVTYEPVLPAGRTWANVLQGVDRIEFTTAEPGWFYGFTNFNMMVDNISIRPVPGAGAMGVFAVAGLASIRRRRG